MIILEDYRKTEKLLRKLGGLSKGFGFTVTVSDETKDDSGEAINILKSDILELNSKIEVLQGENETLIGINSQLVNESKASKVEIKELNSKIKDLNKAPIETKEPRKRRTKEEMEADKIKG